MYCCTDCGHIFAEPGYFIETHGLDNPPYETRYACPKCGGSYAITYKCSCCGEYIVDSYVKTEDGERYCSECYRMYELGDEE